jgi:hypothetical protein
MSNEIAVNFQLKVNNPAGSTAGYVQNITQNKTYNQNTVGANAEVVSVPTVPTTYTFPNLAVEGFLYLQNLDTTNFVLYGTSVSGTFYPMGLIEAGEVHFLRLDPLITFAMAANLQAPAQPTLSTNAAGGTVAAGTYKVIVTYVNASGESLGSVFASITTTGSTSTITITSPPVTGGGSGAATGWYAYVTQAGGSTYFRQQAPGSPTAIGTNLVLTAPPTNTGANPPGAATTTQVNINYLLLSD